MICGLQSLAATSSTAFKSMSGYAHAEDDFVGKRYSIMPLCVALWWLASYDS